MVAGYIQPMQPVIQGEGENSNISVPKAVIIRAEPLGLRRRYKITEVFDDGVIGDKHEFVPLERDAEGIRVDGKADYYQNGYV